jgi:DNA-binding transcriptional MerR regulator
MSEEENREYDEANILFCAIQHAQAHGMEIEFIQSFLDEFKRAHDLLGSISFAYREWDL